MEEVKQLIRKGSTELYLFLLTTYALVCIAVFCWIFFFFFFFGFPKSAATKKKKKKKKTGKLKTRKGTEKKDGNRSSFADCKT